MKYILVDRPSNRPKNKLFLGEKTEFEVPEENVDEANYDDPTEEELNSLASDRVVLRQKALKSSNYEAEKMVKRELKRQPPSLFYKGESVLLRIPISKKPVKGKKTSLKNGCEGRIIDANHNVHKYKIEYNYTVTSKNKQAWFKVDDVTSLTKEEENKRQQIAKENIRQSRKRLKAECESHFETDKVRGLLQKASRKESVLDASIHQIISGEKLNGDTINFYFDYLNENFAARSEVNLVGLGSSYLYPSLERGGDAYRKYISNKSLWEYENIMIPVHLPHEEHWFLLVISILNLCIYIYDSASCHPDSYKTVLDTIRNKFIKNECELLSSEESALFQENNWDEDFPICLKQKNKTDCGVLICLLAKHLMSGEQCNSADIKLDHPRDEMASDLLNLATSETDRFQDFPESLQWMFGDDANQNESPKSKLDKEVTSAGLSYRQPPTPKDGNCLFHTISDQLKRMGKPPQTASQLRTDVVSFLKSNPTTPDGIHFREFVNHGGWETYLRRMSMDGEWGDYIALLGLVDMLDIPVAVVSSLGEEGLHIIYPSKHTKKEADFDNIALVGHEAESHFHSLQQMDAVTMDVVEELKSKYGEGRITEDQICPKCGKKFDSYSSGVYEGENGLLQVYADDSVFCENCLQEDWESY